LTNLDRTHSTTTCSDTISDLTTELEVKRLTRTVDDSCRNR